ncbi:MAG: hypothetical protein K1X72_15190 [Pyrinomonadaceae bacterium]|nr:hypothetical protein [Pyrinomonadaceae bacterium]
MGKPKPMETPNLSYLKRIIRQGMTGNDIKKVQERLDTLNSFYRFCPISTLDCTGNFGKTTHKFVTFFQIWASDADLVADGYVDKATADCIEDYFQAVANYYVN